jgi:Uncharacterized protein conserved in bacteria (DUF2252)
MLADPTEGVMAQRGTPHDLSDREMDRRRSHPALGASDVFDRSISEFAEAYADQNERDFQALKDAAASGRVVAKTGV